MIQKIYKALKEYFGYDEFREYQEERKELALREGYPPYVIFPDSTLIEMCRVLPLTLDEFSYIKGVGENRKNKYGETF